MSVLNEGDRFVVSPDVYTCLYAKVVSEGMDGAKLILFSDGTQSCDFTEQHENWLRLEPEEDILYLAGPMRGYEQYNSSTFNAAATLLLHAGYEHVINPIELDYEFGYDYEDLPEFHDWNEVPLGFSLEMAASRCMTGVTVADRVILLPGWRDSKGATAEYAMAQWLGKPTLEASFYENESGHLNIFLTDTEQKKAKDGTLRGELYNYGKKFLTTIFKGEQ